MVIESSTTSKTPAKNIAKKAFTFTAYSLLIVFGVVTTIAAIGSGTKTPTGSYLSPLPQGELAQTTPSPTPVPTSPTKSAPELINLAQNYLDKAFNLAKVSNQTKEQKDKIIDNLDQSLSFTTQAISQEPRNPKAYILRAQILTAVSKTNPSALTQAQKDLETAQGLSQGQPITLPESINPLNLLPDQQALASSDLILAAPEDTATGSASGEISSNSFTTKVSLLAGQTELQVDDSRITSSSYIYLIPETDTNTSVFVKAKGEGQFTLSVSTASDNDLIINYYIITP
jgi:hypothetical protein